MLAAENRSFYTDPGISFTGIIRAAWNNVTGGSTQGGSTITQQYVKNAILQNSDQTFAAKFQELFLAIKLDNNYSKDQILENYLNTIYYGRGAYGIEVGGQHLLQGARRAADRPAGRGARRPHPAAPSGTTPRSAPRSAQDRWGKVLDAMVEEGWMTAGRAAASVYPPVQPKAGSSLGIPPGPEGLIVSRSLDELETRHGYDEQQIRRRWPADHHDVDKGYQDAAGRRRQRGDGTASRRRVLREALVAVDPKTGRSAPTTAVIGRHGLRLRAGPAPAGLVDEALRAGHRARAGHQREGPAGRQLAADVPGPPEAGRCATPAVPPARRLHPAGGDHPVAEHHLLRPAYEVGPENVRDTMARGATGLPEAWGGRGPRGRHDPGQPETGGTGSAIGIGEYEMRPIDQAVGFATFASGGVQRDPYFVAKVTDTEGTVLLENAGRPGRAGDRPPTSPTTSPFALEGRRAVLEAGAGRRPGGGQQDRYRRASTDENNSDAWMVGYTPSISTAVWMGTDGTTRSSTPTAGSSTARACPGRSGSSS